MIIVCYDSSVGNSILGWAHKSILKIKFRNQSLLATLAIGNELQFSKGRDYANWGREGKGGEGKVVLNLKGGGGPPGEFL